MDYGRSGQKEKSVLKVCLLLPKSLFQKKADSARSLWIVGRRHFKRENDCSIVFRDQLSATGMP